MMRSKPGHGRCVLLTCAIVMAATPELRGERSGNLLGETRRIRGVSRDRANDWMDAKAELVVNKDPAAGDLDDMDVALWAVAALQGCEQQAGHGNQTSENQFSRHMAHWREHIHGVAQTVRQRVGRIEA